MTTKVNNRMIDGALTNVKDFGAIGDGVVDDTVAIQSAFNSGGAVVLPNRTYHIGGTLQIQDKLVVYSDNAKFTHTDNTLTFLEAIGKSDWAIKGKLTIEGLNEAGGDTGEVGLHLQSNARFTIEGLKVTNIRGRGILMDGGDTTVAPNRAERGQMTDLYITDCQTGVYALGGASSEYITWSNTIIGGCDTGVYTSAGNHTWSGGNIVDNDVGVRMTSGSNGNHGMFMGVNINHNTTYNIHADNVANGHDFIGCHLYGNGGTTGAIFLDHCKGIKILGGHWDCYVYNYEDTQTEGYNYISDMYCPGAYGLQLIKEGGGEPQRLIVKNCVGEGSVTFADATINVPSDVSVMTSLVGTSVLGGNQRIIFPTVASRGNVRGAYDTTTGVFTVPDGMAGKYRIVFNVMDTGAAGATDYVRVRLAGLVLGQFGGVECATEGGSTFAGSLDVSLAEGDTIDLIGNFFGNTAGNVNSRAFLSINKIA